MSAAAATSRSTGRTAADVFQLLAESSVGVFLADRAGRVLALNASLMEGRALPASVRDLIAELDASRWERLLASLNGGDTALLAPAGLGSAGAGLRAVELRLLALPSEQEVLGLVFPLVDRQQEAAVGLLQRDVLESVALGRPLGAVLDLLCRQVESLAPEVVCSIVRIDQAGLIRPLAGPSLPASYAAQLDGAPIGPSAGSCGTAAFRGEEVEVQDIANDPLWADYRELALPLGLRACWSSPVFGRSGRVDASFALYFREPRGPSRFHRRMVEACTQLCRIAIQHEDNQAQIERLAYFDLLTGLPNRALLQDRARVALNQAGRDGRKLGLAVLDLDRFKTINDSMGHAAGDRVLAEVGQRLRNTLRDSDTVSRVGGDEFVILFPNSDARESAIAADKVLRTLAAPIDIDGQSYAPSVSIGISQFPDDARDFDTLMRNADVAMYEAKRDGRGCVRFFLSSMNEAARWRLQMESALRLAMSRESLELYYQPKILLGRPGLAGVEALLRWKHPEHGFVPPDQFIPLAEDCGLINALDAWVLERACAQLADWRLRGLQVPSMAVNQSAQRFSHDDVPAHVRLVLQRHGLAPGMLVLEITERLMLDDAPRIRTAMDSLSMMGVHLSVDDFGTGYSSLSYLKRLPVDELKLDRSFVNDIETDPSDRALASAVIGIGRSLGQNVVAEGVETEQQHRLLMDAGCPAAQGYLYARPMPAADFEAWLAGPGLRWLRPLQPVV